MAEQYGTDSPRVESSLTVNRTAPGFQLKREPGGRDCSLQSITGPPSDYRIFYRTFARRSTRGMHGRNCTAETRIDKQLTAIQHMPSEPGIRRALSLAQWISESHWLHEVTCKGADELEDAPITEQEWLYT